VCTSSVQTLTSSLESSYALVLLTPDDEGRLRPATGEQTVKLHGRARQNVVFELGYFRGRLGSARVAALVSDPSLEQPSDIQGVLYIDAPTVSDTAWRLKLAKEMKAAGLEIDLNALS
jgi:predicted nucleotide-binding protein